MSRASDIYALQDNFTAFLDKKPIELRRFSWGDFPNTLKYRRESASDVILLPSDAGPRRDRRCKTITVRRNELGISIQSNSSAVLPKTRPGSK
ncbi:hypothetical protein EOD23_20365 [Mesorhizobium sp. USDA-HM6]|nr:hypothetical protein EOD23_20365 [Mesorhizobium sp. USDA-HM6]